MHTKTTDTYAMVDGPVENTVGHRTPGRFKVEFLSVSRVDGKLDKVYIKGPTLTVDGRLGKSSSARTFFSDYPQWVLDFLQNEVDS